MPNYGPRLLAGEVREPPVREDIPKVDAIAAGRCQHAVIGRKLPGPQGRGPSQPAALATRLNLANSPFPVADPDADPATTVTALFTVMFV